MAIDGFRDLTMEDLKTPDGLNELNRMLKELFDNGITLAQAMAEDEANTDEKVKADAGATAGYLDAIVDDVTTEITGADKLALKLGHEVLIKGWVNLDGSGVISWTDYNVDTITDNAVGDYTITWDTDFADAEYSVAGMGQGTAATARTVFTHTIAAGTLRINTRAGGGSVYDGDPICVMAIGSQ